MEKLVGSTFHTEATEESRAEFCATLQEFGLDAMIDLCENSNTVSFLSQLGSAREAKLKASRELTARVAKIDAKVFAWKKACDNAQNRAKLRVLEDLNPEVSKGKKLKRAKRRRLAWNQKKSKPSSQKRIKETFDSVTPIREYKRKITIEERLEVVRWYNAMVNDGKDAETKKEDGKKKDEEDEENAKDDKSQKKKKQKKKSEQKEAAQEKGKKRRRNLLALARKQFPGIVNQHTSLSRWAHSAKIQQWESLPEKVRKEAKEVPDEWKSAFGLGLKGKQRFQQVPSEVLKSLDEHMCLICQGVSAVTERCEEVLLAEIVQSSVTELLHFDTTMFCVFVFFRLRTKCRSLLVVVPSGFTPDWSVLSDAVLTFAMWYIYAH